MFVCRVFAATRVYVWKEGPYIPHKGYAARVLTWGTITIMTKITSPGPEVVTSNFQHFIY